MARKVYAKMTNEIHGFTKTKERIEVATQGWDGKGYDGEARKFNVWTCPMHPGKKFVHHRKSFGGDKFDVFHEIDFNDMVTDPNGVQHPGMRFSIIDFEVPYELVQY